MMEELSLIELYNHPSVNRLSEFASVAGKLDIPDLAQKYKNLVEKAPRRQEAGKQYFVGHKRFEAREGSNRKEEILAGGLFNYCREGHPIKLPDGGDLQIIDYQFPLKAKRDDKNIGKIDLFGVVNKTIPSVIELKVDQDGGGKPDTPLRAILEGLAYCAIVEANQEAISKEASSKFGLSLQSQALDLVVLGPKNYWDFFIDNEPAGPWQDAIRQLATQVSRTLTPRITLLSIQNLHSDSTSPQNSSLPAQLQYLF